MEAANNNGASDEMSDARREYAEEFTNQNLTIIEHMFIGSSEKVKGELWGIEEVRKHLKQLKQGKNENILRKKLLTPLLLLHGANKIKEVSKARLQKKHIEGLLFIFDLGQQLAWEKNKIKPYLELGSLDEKGQVSGKWKIGLKDEKNNEIDSLSIKLDQEFAKYFTLKKDPSGKGQFLKLKL